MDLASRFAQCEKSRGIKWYMSRGYINLVKVFARY